VRMSYKIRLLDELKAARELLAQNGATEKTD
jgi:hypothetical protein